MLGRLRIALSHSAPSRAITPTDMAPVQTALEAPTMKEGGQNWVVVDRQPKSQPKELSRTEHPRDRGVCYFGNRCLRVPNCPYLHTTENIPNYDMLSKIQCPRGGACRASDCWYAHADRSTTPGEAPMQLQLVRIKSRAERRAERRRPVHANARVEHWRGQACTSFELDANEARELEERLKLLCGDSPEL